MSVSTHPYWGGSPLGLLKSPWNHPEMGPWGRWAQWWRSQREKLRGGELRPWRWESANEGHGFYHRNPWDLDDVHQKSRISPFKNGDHLPFQMRFLLPVDFGMWARSLQSWEPIGSASLNEAMDFRKKLVDEPTKEDPRKILAHVVMSLEIGLWKGGKSKIVFSSRCKSGCP